jgi:amino acid adenylation domain-containing protein
MELNDIEESYLLSPMQQGMLFHSLYAPQSGVDIEQMVMGLRETLDISAFTRAWQRVVEWHPALRTSFRWDGLSEPVQEVHRQVRLSLTQQDWCGLSAHEQGSRLEAYLCPDRQRGFDLSQAPLMRLALFRLGEADYRCLWTFHHILLDGRSLPIVLREVFAFYDAFRRGQDLQLEQPRPYRDHIAWLQQQDTPSAEGFWRPALEGFTAPTPLVVDRLLGNAPGLEEGHGEQELRLSEATTAALESFAQGHQLRLNTLIQAAWALLLSRYGGEEDVLFGVTRACRRSSVEGAESMVGLFINTLPFRVRVPHGMPVLPWLKELRAQHLALRDYEHTPLVNIQEWSELPGGTPLFDSILVFENYLLNSVLQAQGGSWQNRDFRLLEQTNYPLTVTGYRDRHLLLKIAYDKRRFDGGTITRMLGHLETLLVSMIAGPDRQLSALPLLTETERHQVLVGWNGSGTGWPQGSEQPIHQLFEAQAKRTPEAVAVVFPTPDLPDQAGQGQDERLTYRELNLRANQVAHYLRALGVGPETLVGICLERSPETVVAILGVLKAGGAYVPLDPAYPKERLAFIMEDSQCPVLLTESRLLQNLPASMARVVCLDTDRNAMDRESAENLASGVTADNLAYVIYTSGSTGKPKGVLITHHNVVRLFEATHPWFHFDHRDVWTLFHSYAFDFSVWEMWGALLYGGQLVVVPYWVSRSPHAFYNLLRTQRVTVLNQTPSAFRQLIRAEEEVGVAGDLALRLVIFGGEALELNSLKPWFERHGDALPQLVNMYGITETTVHVTYRPLTRADLNQAPGSVIGRPIPDLQVYLLDQHLQPVAIGVPGELYVGGAGLTRGYLNRPELTAERFVPHRFSDQPGACLYRSGDLARYLPTGDIEYLGRIDHQIKLRGFRIELGEIEAVLCQHPAVRESLVLAREGASGEKQLVAYVVPDQKQGPRASQLRTFLSSQLPDYMIPSAVVTLENLPLTPNGKVDRGALPPPEMVRPELEKGFAAPRDSLELQLAKVWEQVLGLQPIGIKDNFFELGGHSLLAVRLITQMKRVFGRDLPVSSLFQAPTVEQLADVLRQAGWSSPCSSLVPILPHGSNPPLFFLPGNLGNVFLDLGDLALYLGPGQPVYGLQDGVQNPSQIHALAAHYIDEIRTVQPEGPYLLAGICSGGVIAFEMAQQLRARDQEVILLALVEPPPPARPGLHRHMAGIFSILRMVAQRFTHHARLFLHNSSDERGTYARLKAKVISNMWAVARYVPRPYSGHISLFLAEDPSEPTSYDPRMNWQGIATGGLEVHIIPGSHDAITRTGVARSESQAQALAQTLRTCIERALADAPGE